MLGNGRMQDIIQRHFCAADQGSGICFPEHERAWLIKVTVNLCRSQAALSLVPQGRALLDSHPAESSEDRGLVEAILALPAGR